MQAKITKIEEAPMPNWVLINTEGSERPLAISHNWFGKTEELGLPVPKAGDVIEFEVLEKPHYSGMSYYQFITGLKVVGEA